MPAHPGLADHVRLHPPTYGGRLSNGPRLRPRRGGPSEDRAGGSAATPPAARPAPDAQAVDPTDLDAALDLARAGDERGFVVLYRALHPLLLRYLRVRSRDAADDVAAEVWLQVVRDLPHFQGGAAALRGWLFTVARHRAIDHARARAARPAVPVAEPVEPRVPAASAEAVAGERDATRDALALVATLPPEQAEMVLLRVVAGLDVQSVADIVGKQPGTVRVAVHRALRTLADRLPRDPADPAGPAGPAGDTSSDPHDRRNGAR
ncbi:RNA polymerase sigma factor [Nocardioides litoris]|uniref:RNA polymerase sigma factor n=1 Tax=Nocardioides litoris TaxID=1926648 RepID=UPI001B886E97|nr:RNA polymerase sigma factor [Nocardioides litoris]